MSNPYTPPATPDEPPHRPSPWDTIPRWLGALSLGYVITRIILNPVPDLQTKLVGPSLLLLFIYGFLRRGRKFHLGTALFMALSIVTQTYFVQRAIAHPERLTISLGPHPWLDFILGIIPHTIALICASLLYLRARRAAPASKNPPLD